MITETTLQRIDPARRMARRYSMGIDQDLFGQWLLTRQWGRIGRQGRGLTMSFPTADDARAALERLRVAKIKRGYRPK